MSTVWRLKRRNVGKSPTLPQNERTHFEWPLKGSLCVIGRPSEHGSVMEREHNLNVHMGNVSISEAVRLDYYLQYSNVICNLEGAKLPSVEHLRLHEPTQMID